jgi:hypothetical protein
MQGMSSPIRRDLDLARLAARERRLRLVMQILKGREVEYHRAQQPTPPALRQSIAGFGAQLGETARQHAELRSDRRPPLTDSRGARARPGRFETHRPRGFLHEPS